MSTATLGSLLPVPVVVLIAGAVLSPLAGRLSRHGPLAVGVLATTGAAAVLALLCPRVYGGTLLAHYLGGWEPVGGHALGVAFAADPFGLTYALLAAAIGCLLLVYSLAELGGLGPRELGGFGCLVQLLIAALVGSALSADAFNLFVWFQVAALASYGLTCFFLERPLAVEAGFKIIVLTNIAAFLVFVGVALLYAGHGALNLGQTYESLGGRLTGPSLVAIGLLVAGFATKAGLVPFHGWLPDAHTAAPGPVSALFSGLMVNVGIVGLARFALVAGYQPRLMDVLTVLGCVSAVGGALLALAQDDLKRLLAYDTVSQLGILTVGLGTATATGLAGTTYHLVSHALFKSLLFLCAGAIMHATGMTRLSQMGGLARHRPFLAGAFVVGVCAIAGIPPLNGYVSLGLIHDELKKSDPVAFVAVLVAQVVTVAALTRATYLAFFRRRDDDYDRLERPTPDRIIPFAVLAAACVGFGIVPQLVLDHVAAPAAGWLLDGKAYADAVLAGHGTMRPPPVAFHYFAPAELVVAGGSIVLGLLLAWWYVRRPHTPRPLRALRVLQTGSVNDYAGYLVLGTVLVVLALLL